MPKVARFHRLGGPEVLQFDESTFEDPFAGELLLKVKAIGINRMEVFFRAGGFGPPKEFPAMLGSECAGTVLAVGEGIKGFCTGDHVATIPGSSSVLGFATGMKGHECAVYGEQPYVPADMVVKMPNDIGNVVRGNLSAQITQSQGAIPICTTRSRSKVAALKSIGIEHVIVASEQGIATEVARITDGIGCPVIHDPIARENINKLLDALAINGILLIYGVLDLSPALIDLLKGMAKFATIKFSAVFQTLSNPKKRAKMVTFVLRGIAEGVVRLVIDKTFSFHDIAEAHRYLQSNQHVGKVIVTVD
ncbi:Polyketide synthase, enoylreductase domain [Fusarium oxysporum f. sp. vasinfectum]|nr:Polyketide synthase, enoylreductase domain [Fusarium oxysporum f. sp. vasinfectum]